MVFFVLPMLFLQALLANDNVAAPIRAKAANPSLPLSDRSRAYEELIRQNPSDTTLYAGYAALLIANRSYELALAWIAKALVFAPADSALRLRQAIALHASGKPEASLRILEALPASGESQFYMGLDCRALGDHKTAQRRLSEAWDLGFHDPYALYSLIEEDRVLGDKAAGLRHFKSFLEKFPDSAWLHVLYANAYIKKRQNTEARSEYQEALRLKADLPGVNFRLGYLLYEDSQYAPAAECFRKEIALNPYYSDANLFLGQTLRNLGREDAAMTYLRKAIALDPRSGLAYQALAALLTERSDLSGAAEILGKAEQEFPADPSFPAQLAGILTKLNRREEALKEQEKFRSLRQAKSERPVETKQ